MSDLQEQGLGLYGDQYRFVYDSRRFTSLIGGVGSGKSIGGAAKAFAASQGVIGNQRIQTPNTGIVTAPTYNVLRDATLPAFIDRFSDYIDRKNSAFSPPIRLRMINGSEVLFRSANEPELLRGPSITWWWGDEAALYVDLVWKIMIGRLRQFGRFGWAWLTTTPRGRNWIWKRFVERITAHYKMYRVRTRDNPFLDPEYIAALEEDYVGDFARQELDGEFISFEGLIYSMFDRALHTVMANLLPAQDRLVKVVAGQDWGMVNPGVLAVLGITSDDRAYVLHEERARRRGIDEWASVAVQLRDLYGIQEIYCDPSEPDYIRKYKDAGLKAIGADNTVSTGIQLVSKRLVRRADNQPGLLISRNAVEMLSEFEQYQWMKRGDQTLDQPVKANDHGLDALRYAIMGVDGRRKAPKAEVRQYA